MFVAKKRNYRDFFWFKDLNEIFHKEFVSRFYSFRCACVLHKILSIEIYNICFRRSEIDLT